MKSQDKKFYADSGIAACMLAFAGALMMLVIPVLADALPNTSAKDFAVYETPMRVLVGVTLAFGVVSILVGALWPVHDEEEKQT